MHSISPETKTLALVLVKEHRKKIVEIIDENKRHNVDEPIWTNLLARTDAAIRELEAA